MNANYNVHRYIQIVNYNAGRVVDYKSTPARTTLMLIVGFGFGFDRNAVILT